MMIAVHHDNTFKETRFCVRAEKKTQDRVEYVARDHYVCPQTDRLLRSC